MRSKPTCIYLVYHFATLWDKPSIGRREQYEGLQTWVKVQIVSNSCACAGEVCGRYCSIVYLNATELPFGIDPAFLHVLNLHK